MKLTKILAMLMACVMLLTLCTACGEEGEETTKTDGSSESEKEELPPAKSQKVNTEAYADEDYGFQQEMPEEGETVAIIHTSMGDISLRLFPEAAPKAVENFLTHAKAGYYNGVIFHRVIEDFMIQGGDPEGTGSGGESIWGESFEDEFCDKLMNIRGSLAMANGGPKTNGSQFFINQGGPTGKTGEDLKKQYDFVAQYAQMKSYYEQYIQMYGESFSTYYPTVEDFINNYAGGICPDSRLVPDEVWELYAKVGGNIHLDGAWRSTGGHTVFGHVYAGMDVVDEIAKVKVGENDKPEKDVIIKSIEVTAYSK